MTGKSMEQKSLPRNTAKREWKHHFWIQLLVLQANFHQTQSIILSTLIILYIYIYIIYTLLMLNIHANYINVCYIYLSNQNTSNSFLKLPLVLVLTYLYFLSVSGSSFFKIFLMQIIFKVFIEFATTLLLFSALVFWL